MATITPTPINTAGASLTLAAASAGGDTIATNLAPRVVLIVRNTNGASINVTLTGVVACSQGSTHNVVKACPTGQDTDIVIPGQCVDPTTGNVAVAYSAATGVTVAATTF